MYKVKRIITNFVLLREQQYFIYKTDLIFIMTIFLKLSYLLSTTSTIETIYETFLNYF